MKKLSFLVTIYKYIAISALTFLMLFISFGVFSRLLFTPIIGDVELVQLGMVVIIMFGLIYSESIDGHISIGLIVDRFSEKYQNILSIIALLLTGIVSLVVAFVFFNLTIEHFTTTKLTTNLIRIPYYPFDFIICLGFLGWGLMALTKIILKVMQMKEASE